MAIKPTISALLATCFTVWATECRKRCVALSTGKHDNIAKESDFYKITHYTY